MYVSYNNYVLTKNLIMITVIFLQIERLRHVFTDLFPVPVESGRSPATYPPHHLRPFHTQQAFYSDPGPPTPPVRHHTRTKVYVITLSYFSEIQHFL